MEPSLDQPGNGSHLGGAESRSLTWHLFPGVLVSIFGILVACLILRSGNVTTLGSDTITHIYKLHLLINQIHSIPATRWGTWDWSWYLGYPYLSVYSPGTYYLLAILESVPGVGDGIALTVLILLAYPAAGLAAYAFAFDNFKSRSIGLAAAIVYLSATNLTTEITIDGSITRLPAFILVPLAFLFQQRLLNSLRFRPLTFVGAVLTLFLLSTVELYYAMIVFTFVVLQSMLSLALKRGCWQSLLTAPIAFLAASFLILPVFEGVNAWAGPSIPTSMGSVGSALTYLLSPYKQGPGPIVIGISIVGLALLLFDKKSSKTSPFSAFTLPYALSFLCYIAFFFAIYAVGPIFKPTNLIMGQSALIIAPVVSIPLAGYLVSWVDRRLTLVRAVGSPPAESRIRIRGRHVTVTLVIVAMVFSSVVTSSADWHQSPPSLWTSTYQDVSHLAGNDVSVANPWNFSAVDLPDNGTQLVLESRTYSNFTLESSVIWISGKEGNAALVFWYSNESNYYLFYIDTLYDDSGIYHYSHGVTTYIARGPASLSSGGNSSLELICLDFNISADLNGQVLFHASGYSGSGLLGLQSFATQVRFYQATVATFEPSTSNWFRAWEIPSYPPMLYAEQSQGIASPVGWYTQAEPQAAGLAIQYVQTDPVNYTLAVNLLKVEDIKFVILDASFPPEGVTVASLEQGLLGTSQVALVQSVGGISVYQVADLQPIWTSPNECLVNETTYLSTLSNTSFNPYSTVFASAEGSQPGSCTRGIPEAPIPTTLYGISQSLYSISIGVRINGSGYLCIPISYSPEFAVTVDGASTPYFQAYPGIVAIKINGGYHTIGIEVNPSELPTEITLLTLSGLTVYGFVVVWRRFRRRWIAQQ